MRVFITWSGDRSRKLAEIIRKWLPGVLQSVKPYFSPDDVAKGARWFPEISKELDESRVGLLCITRDNLSAPWLLFEAGALGKNLEKSKVCPLLFGVEPTDLKGPLTQFQGARFTKVEFKQTVKMINGELGESGLSNDVFDGVFDMWWPKLDEETSAVLEATADEETGQNRTDRDILEELLDLNRSMARERRLTRERIDPDAIMELYHRFRSLIRMAADLRMPEQFLKELQSVSMPVEYIMMRSALPGNLRRRAHDLRKDVEQLRLSNEGDSEHEDMIPGPADG